MIHVVAGIICNSIGEILVALRPKHVLQGGLWEFPGGKIEAGETPFQALVRELQEEINIHVVRAKHFMSLQHQYPERVVMLEVWQIEEFDGTPHGNEGQEIRWVTAHVLAELDFPEGNREVVELLKRG